MNRRIRKKKAKQLRAAAAYLDHAGRQSSAHAATATGRAPAWLTERVAARAHRRRFEARAAIAAAERMERYG